MVAPTGNSKTVGAGFRPFRTIPMDYGVYLDKYELLRPLFIGYHDQEREYTKTFQTPEMVTKNIYISVSLTGNGVKK